VRGYASAARAEREERQAWGRAFDEGARARERGEPACTARMDRAMEGDLEAEAWLDGWYGDRDGR
jgi:hypothetical protein